MKDRHALHIQGNIAASPFRRQGACPFRHGSARQVARDPHTPHSSIGINPHWRLSAGCYPGSFVSASRSPTLRAFVRLQARLRVSRDIRASCARRPECRTCMDAVLRTARALQRAPGYFGRAGGGSRRARDQIPVQLASADVFPTPRGPHSLGRAEPHSPSALRRAWPSSLEGRRPKAKRDIRSRWSCTIRVSLLAAATCGPRWGMIIQCVPTCARSIVSALARGVHMAARTAPAPPGRPTAARAPATRGWLGGGVLPGSGTCCRARCRQRVRVVGMDQARAPPPSRAPYAGPRVL
jgi:hypothetical protein